jgi:hypothetical protein
MALQGFAPSGYASLSASGTSQNVALPAGTTALVTNLGTAPVFVLLGPTNAVSVTPQTGVAILPGASLALTTGANGFLAACTSQGGGLALLNIAVGT